VAVGRAAEVVAADAVVAVGDPEVRAEFSERLPGTSAIT
jgi:hypothetical protein